MPLCNNNGSWIFWLKIAWEFEVWFVCIELRNFPIHYELLIHRDNWHLSQITASAQTCQNSGIGANTLVQSHCNTPMHNVVPNLGTHAYDTSLQHHHLHCYGMVGNNWVIAHHYQSFVVYHMVFFSFLFGVLNYKLYQSNIGVQSWKSIHIRSMYIYDNKVDRTLNSI